LNRPEREAFPDSTTAGPHPGVEPPSDRPIGLPALLCIALLARLPAVLFAKGYQFLDQQFQYIDPAWHLATGDAFERTHEWTMGLRSWVYPGLLAGLFRIERSLGVHDPETQLVLARLLQAFLSFIPVTASWLLLTHWRPVPRARTVLLAFSCFYLSVLCGNQPNGATFAALFSVSAVLLFHGPGFRWPFLSGLCLGLAFCGRPQDALLGPVLAAAGLLAGRRAATLALCLGSIPGILLQGFTDLATWGAFLHSPFAYLKFNLFDGRNAGWGREPLWYYPALVLLALLILPPFVRIGLRQLLHGARILPLCFAAALAYLALHSIPAHKAARFVEPALLLLYLCAFLGFFHDRNPTSILSRLHARVLFAAHLVAYLLVSFWAPARGPTEAAAMLGSRADFENHLVLVDGSRINVGGWFYLRRKRLAVHPVPRERWPEAVRPLLDENAAKGLPLYLFVRKRPLDPRRAPPSIRMEEVGRFTDPFDLKRRHRVWLYRLRTRRRG